MSRKPRGDVARRQALPDDLLDNPELFPLDLDVERREVVFVRMSRETYDRSSFLDSRIVTVDDSSYRVDLHELLAFCEARPMARASRFIFHTAFCGSTLLSRCLGRVDGCFALREPMVLYRVLLIKSEQERRRLRSIPAWDKLLRMVMLFLSRTYGGAAVIIKPIDACNMLMLPLMQLGNAALFLHSSLTEFSTQVLKMEDRRQWARIRLANLRPGLGYTQKEVQALTDVQVTALLWMTYVKHYLDAAAMAQVPSLEFRTLLERPIVAIRAVLEHFSIAYRTDELGPAITRELATHSKDATRTYDAAAAEREHRELLARYRDEIERDTPWVSASRRDHGIPWPLPHPLTR